MKNFKLLTLAICICNGFYTCNNTQASENGVLNDTEDRNLIRSVNDFFYYYKKIPLKIRNYFEEFSMMCFDFDQNRMDKYYINEETMNRLIDIHNRLKTILNGKEYYEYYIGGEIDGYEQLKSAYIYCTEHSYEIFSAGKEDVNNEIDEFEEKLKKIDLECNILRNSVNEIGNNIESLYEQGKIDKKQYEKAKDYYLYIVDRLQNKQGK